MRQRLFLTSQLITLTTIQQLYLADNGYATDINGKRLHHEIYMSDTRKVAPEKWKTVIRHPVKKVTNNNFKVLNTAD